MHQLNKLKRFEAFNMAYLQFHGVVPIELQDGKLITGTWREHVDDQVLDDLWLFAGAPPSFVRYPEAEIRAAISAVYEEKTSAQDIVHQLAAGAGDESDSQFGVEDLRVLANEAPVIRLVSMLLLEALHARASDVHLESYLGVLRVRYRIDGVMEDAPAPPPHLRAAVVSRIKIMAQLDIAERRLPQDGRVRLRLDDREVDVRVSTVPTLYGESVVLRLLDDHGLQSEITDLGMAEDTLASLYGVLSKPSGIVLATGPTGSGKTTTLYAAVQHLRTGREKIVTVEDPVEYELPGICQIPVHQKIGLSFAQALRSILRQDPDVLLIGEIRDEETAEIAIHAALTGHLVLSTLHTRDAASALTRLADLGVPGYLIASTVEAVLAQRLVRVVCSACASTRASHEEGGRQCVNCRGTGYRGRSGIYELLLMDDELREMLGQNSGAAMLRQAATVKGMRSLRQDGERAVRLGITTEYEITRVAAS
jgi:general secretion pathway protein E